MKKLLTVFVFLAGFMAVSSVMAQVYEKQYKAMTGPMDRAAAQSKADWENVAEVGHNEWSDSAEERYTNMTSRLDRANTRHFEAAENYQTINELPNGEFQNEPL